MPDGLMQIKDWNKNFENAKSRQIDRCSSVHLPNKAAGLGLSRVLAEDDGAAIFGIFVLLVEACSRHPRPRNGWLTLDGHPEATPWTLGDLEVILHRPAKEIRRALDVLSSPAMGWIKVTGKCPAGDHEVASECPPGSREVDPNERTNEGTKEPPLPPRQPSEPDPPATAGTLPLTITEVLKFTNSPAFANVDRTAILRTLTREKVPGDRWKDVLAVVEKSLSTRRPPPTGVKDSPTGYAVKVIEGKAAEIRDAALADAEARRDQNVARFKGEDFTEEEKAELVEKYRTKYPGMTVVFDNDVQPFEADPKPPPSPKPAKTPPPTKDDSPPPGGDGRPAPYHLLKEFPVLWGLRNRAQIIGALVDMKPDERLPALRRAMERTRGPHPGETTLEDVVYQTLTQRVRETEDPVHAADSLEDTDETS